MANLNQTIAPLSTIIGWFAEGAQPTNVQFETTWKSFFHKSENIPVEQIYQLTDVLNNKAEREHLHLDLAKRDGSNLSVDDINGLKEVLGVALAANGIINNIEPTITSEEANVLQDGIYKPKTTGVYSSIGLTAKENYTTLFKKLDGIWSVFSEEELPLQDLTEIENRITVNENKVDDYINFSSPKIDFDLNGFYHLDSGILLNSNGYFSTKKYKAHKDLKFINPFKGAGGASQVVFFKENGEFLTAYQNQNIITTPNDAYFVAFSTNIENSGVQVQSSFWSYQQSKTDDDYIENKINILKNDNSNLLNSISSLNTQIDEITDVNFPYIIDIGNYIKTYGSGGGLLSPINEYTVVRASDYTITGDFTLVNDNLFSITVLDNDDKFHFVSVIKESNTVLKSNEILPLNFSKMMTTQGDSQHLSRYGYKALAQYLIEETTRYSKRKNKMFSAISADCQPLVKDWIKNGQTLILINRLPNTATGGWLNEELKIVGSCGMGSDSSEQTSGRMFKKGYDIQQNTADKGMKFNLTVGGYDGYVSINLGERPRNENSINVTAKNQNGVELYNQNVRGVNTYLHINFTADTTSIEITIKTIATGLTLYAINLIEIFKTYTINEPIFKKNHTAMFVLDSWGEFPTLQPGETGYVNPLGKTMNGLGYLPKFYSEYLGNQGFNVVSKNYSFGGRTVKWANNWINYFLDNETNMPDFVFLDFAINDSNSRNYIDVVGTNYDFDTENPYLIKYENNGGIKGAITLEEHISYYKSLIKKIYKAGSVPVLLINPLLSGLSFGLIDTLVAQMNTEFKR